MTAHDPGGKVRLQLPSGIFGSAEFSKCGRYRHVLWRWWGEPELTDQSYALWIGCNPSTAAADVDDPTVRREVIYTRDVLELDAYCKVNVVDYRATRPKDIGNAGPVCSNANLAIIEAFAERASAIIAAWGRVPKALDPHVKNVESVLAAFDLWCLGFTKDGSPRHPLYVRGGTALVRYPEERAP